MTVVVGEGEASLVELKVGEDVGGAAVSTAKQPSLAQHGIARRLVGFSPRCREPLGGGGAKKIGDFARLARPQIDDATPRRMPRSSAGEIDVDVILVGDIGSEHLEDVDFSRGCCARLGLALLIGLQRALVGVRTGVRRRDALDGRVGKHHGAVASRQISAVQALAEEEGVFEGEVVVRGV